MPKGVSNNVTYLDIVAGIKEVTFYCGTRPLKKEYEHLRPKGAPSIEAIRYFFPGKSWRDVLSAVLGPPRKRRS